MVGRHQTGAMLLKCLGRWPISHLHVWVSFQMSATMAIVSTGERERALGDKVDSRPVNVRWAMV